MARLITHPAVVPSAGNRPKIIEEYVGRVNSGTAAVSIARMHCPRGWTEPGQRPEFDEYTLVLSGVLHVRSAGGLLEVRAGEAVLAPKQEWVQYGTPETEEAEYIAVCLPAFAPDTAHRDPE